MRLLLDTNILIGFLSAPEALDPRAMEAVFAAEAACFSIVSLWEIAQLQVKDRIEMDTEISEIRDIAVKKAGLARIDLTEETIGVYRRLPLFNDHKDPFDRMLAATAIAQQCAFLTSDKAFLRYDLEVLCVKPVF